VAKTKAMAVDAATRIGLDWHAASNAGPRAENQDRASAVEPNDGRIAQRGVLLIVCDGVGGGQGGREAAETAVRAAHDAYYGADGAGVRAWLEAATRIANERVRELARASNQPGMATTIVMAAVLGGRLFTAHVGDSRAYLLRGGVLRAVTEDHRWVQEQRTQGIVEANAGEMRNMITRSLGAAANNTPVVSEGVALSIGDRVMLCTDGLHGVVACCTDAGPAAAAGYPTGGL